MLLAIYLVRWAGVAPMQLGADHSEWGRAWRILNVQVNIFEASVLLVPEICIESSDTPFPSGCRFANLDSYCAAQFGS